MEARHRSLREVRARDPLSQPVELLKVRFAGLLSHDEVVDAQFVDSLGESVIGVAGVVGSIDPVRPHARAASPSSVRRNQVPRLMQPP